MRVVREAYIVTPFLLSYPVIWGDGPSLLVDEIDRRQ